MPNELIKLKIDMDNVFDIYKILEGFNWRFTNEEMDKRWKVFGSNKEIMELINERTSQLDKLKIKFTEEMKDG